MTQKNKPTSTESAQPKANTSNQIVKLRPPLKSEVAIEAFLKRKSMNTMEATIEYGDTCLHTTVSDLYRNHRLEFNRKWETILNRVGKPINVKRFWPENVEHMKQVLAELRKTRGVKS